MTPSHFYTFVIISPLERTWPLNLEFTLPKDDFYQVQLKLASWFWRRFLKIFSVFHLGWDVALHLTIFESPLSPRMICAKSV
jgi:hypothetical protein